MIDYRLPSAESVQPLCIGPKNCESMTGLTWRFVKLVAVRLGVPVWGITERKKVIPAAALLVALQREYATIDVAARPLTEEQEREAARQALARELARADDAELRAMRDRVRNAGLNHRPPRRPRKRSS